jgi:exosome complex component CSL4
MVLHNTGDLVTVGDELAGAEELLGDVMSTYTQDEKIFAATPGFVVIDDRTRSIKVDNKMEKKRKTPRKGDNVICVAEVVRSHSVGCVIYKINNRLLEDGVDAQLHVSTMSRRYVEKIGDAFQKTDIIRATVLGFDGIEWKISTTSNNSGVIFAQCKYCGTVMTRKNRDQIQCPFCGNVERRVLAPDYGMTNELVEF